MTTTQPSTQTTQTTTQPTGKVTPINVPYPETRDLEVRISEGACRLNIVPADGEAWITGTYTDPSGMRSLNIETVGGITRMTENFSGSRVWEWLRAGYTFDAVPQLDLAFGKARPFKLSIEIGASDNRLDLGGLPISRLSFKHGAGKTTIDFSAPNPQVMTLMNVGAGAGSTELSHLANARFAELTVEGGMAGFVLDFGGTLQQDAHARISCGLASVDVNVPPSTLARILTESPLGHIEVGEGFTTHADGALWTSAATEVDVPVLTIDANVALGTLTLRAKP
ncbi:MAG: hypothetical protein ACM3N4_04350 [Nitrososphaerota archaeon]